MIDKQFERTSYIFKKENMAKLKKANVLVFGVGGVGGYVVEALVRSGIYNISLVDFDRVDITNINRQIIATLDTVGKLKVDVMKERILSINRNAKVNTFPIFYDLNNSDIDFSKYDYIVDCIDTISSKIDIISQDGRC